MVRKTGVRFSAISYFAFWVLFERERSPCFCMFISWSTRFAMIVRNKNMREGRIVPEESCRPKHQSIAGAMDKQAIQALRHSHGAYMWFERDTFERLDSKTCRNWRTRAAIRPLSDPPQRHSSIGVATFLPCYQPQTIIVSVFARHYGEFKFDFWWFKSDC